MASRRVVASLCVALCSALAASAQPFPNLNAAIKLTTNLTTLTTSGQYCQVCSICLVAVMAMKCLSGGRNCQGGLDGLHSRWVACTHA